MFDVLLCTASILNLCAISVDRYFIILHSMSYTQRRNFKLMLLMILIVWLLAGLISIPPLFGWGKPSARLQREQVCAVSDDLKYQIYATLLAFYLPLIVMIIIYLNIFRAAKKIKKREMETAGRLQYNRQSLSFTQEYQAEPLIQANGKIMSPSSDNNLKSPIKQSWFKKLKKLKKANLAEENHASTLRNVKNESFLNASSGNIASRRSSNVRKLGYYIYSYFPGNKRPSGTSSSGKNQKATKTLGVIMGCFTLCWLPFFILAVFKPIPLGNGFYVADYVPKWLDSILLWLGYFNSALNPMIYARFNREFRRPFVEILCFRCKGINDKLRDEDRKKMYAIETNFSQHSQYITTNNSSANLKITLVNTLEISRVAEETTKNPSINNESIGNQSQNNSSNDYQKNEASELNVCTINESNSPVSSNLDFDTLKKKVKQEKNIFFFGTSDTPPDSNSILNTKEIETKDVETNHLLKPEFNSDVGNTYELKKW